MKRREVFMDTSEMRVAEINEYVGMEFRDGKRIGVVVENSHLTVTVEFNEPIVVSLWHTVTNFFWRIKK